MTMIRHALSPWPLTGLAVRSPSRRWYRLARDVDRTALGLKSVSDDGLRQQAAELRYRARSGEQLDELLVPAFALVVEAARRHIGQRHYEVQVVCGIALRHGCIAEMQTGEGKTLVATLPLFLHALTGKAVHLATANDYLAKRDADWMRPVYESLGLTVEAVTGDMTPAERRRAYDCDLTYGTAREFGFDFLRDRLSLAAAGQSETVRFADVISNTASSVGVRRSGADAGTDASDLRPTIQRWPLGFALIDEADSLLIDEARTPLIVSGPDDEPGAQEMLFRWAASAATELDTDRHLDRDEDTGRIDLTRAGDRFVRALAKPASIATVPVSEIAEAIVRAAYVASSLHRDQQYVIRDGTIQIVDEYTGRVADGRRWRNGVHQAVEAREGVPITPLTQHCARITVPELFGLYERISGMTGTAASATREFASVYGLPVVRVPPRRKNRRKAWRSRMSATSDERWAAVVAEVQGVH
ncbi:MAG: preprotein translocase subunit SecA, partial [Planctomycetota bacterium]